jgi:hypothetical protein
VKKLADLSKDEKIKKEIKRLNAIFRHIDPKLKKTVLSLIENAAFMAVTLTELQYHINEHGVTVEYQNGENQWGTKKSPEVEIYNTMIKNHVTIMKQLADLVPKQPLKDEDDGFDEFVNDR